MQDQGYSEGKIADYTLNQEKASATIKYTNDQDIYMTERHADDSFSYFVPLAQQGVHVLILKFTEMHFKEANKRAFNIVFGDKVVVEKLDIVGKVGPFAAYDEYIEFTFENGKVFFRGEPCENAFDVETGKLKVTFQKIGVDNPKVDGLVLFRGPLAETDFYEIPAMRENWEKRLEMEKKKREEEALRREAAKLKKREKTKVRNDEIEEFEEDFEDIRDNMAAQSSSFLFGPGGLALVFLVMAAAYYIKSSQKSAEVEVARMQIMTSDDGDSSKDPVNKKGKKKGKAN